MSGATAPLWRRNTAGGIVLCAALAFVVATQLWPDWAHYRSTLVPEQTAGRGNSASVDGQRWQVDSVRRIEGGPQTPAGGVETVVTLGREGDSPGQDCTAQLTDGSSRWNADPFATAGAATRCNQPGPLELAFQIPATATPTAVDIVRSDGRIIARLLL